MQDNRNQRPCVLGIGVHRVNIIEEMLRDIGIYQVYEVKIEATSKNMAILAARISDDDRQSVILSKTMEPVQSFLRLVKTSALERVKLIVVDFPTVLNQFYDSRIRWADCVLMGGGSWNFRKLGPPELECELSQIRCLMEGDVSWIISLRRFVPSFKQESHRSSTDDISESFRAEKGINIRKEDQKFIGKKSRLWQKLSFNQVVARYVARLPIDLRAKALKNIVLYQLGFISHFAYNKATRDINSHAPKLNLYSVELRKWMDSSYHGLPLHSAYFDLVLNRGKRGWTTVLRQPFQSSRGQINHSIFVSVNEDDLTFLLSVCPIGMWNIELVQRRFKGSAGEMNAMMSRVPDFKTPDSQKGFQKACFFEMFGISASDFGLF